LASFSSSAFGDAGRVDVPDERTIPRPGADGRVPIIHPRRFARYRRELDDDDDARATRMTRDARSVSVRGGTSRQTWRQSLGLGQLLADGLLD
jgi:hypothetical protein